jgi:hypothetical protein
MIPFSRTLNNFENFENDDLEKNITEREKSIEELLYEIEKQEHYKKSGPVRSSSWKFHTYINPNKNQENDPLITAFELFLKEVTIPKEQLHKEFQSNKIKRIIINTNNNDIIEIPNKNVKQVFLRSKFLENKKFKQRLIDYYNTIGVFIKGPTEFKKRDGTSTNHWIIELNLIYDNKQ